MAIVQVGSTTTAQNTLVARPGTLACNTPTVGGGEVMIALAVGNNRCVTAPGWLPIFSHAAPTAGPALGVFKLTMLYKVAVVGEAASHTFTYDAMGIAASAIVAISAWSGVKQFQPVGKNFAITSSTANNAEPSTGPTATNAASDGRVMYVRACRYASVLGATFSTAVGTVTELADLVQGNAVEYAVGWYVDNSDFTGGGNKTGLAITQTQTETTNIEVTLAMASDLDAQSGMVIA